MTSVNEVIEVNFETKAFLVADKRLRKLRARTEEEDLVSQMAKLSVHSQEQPDLDLRPLTKGMLKPFLAIVEYLRLYGGPSAKEEAQKAANSFKQYSSFTKIEACLTVKAPDL